MNCTHWEVARILKVYRCRWTGTESSIGTASSTWAWADCQLRSGRGQTRHMYMVFLAHSVLMRQLRQGRAREWTRERLTTIGQACMSVLRQTLSDTIALLKPSLSALKNFSVLKYRLDKYIT
jgi:hypothetical protein